MKQLKEAHVILADTTYIMSQTKGAGGNILENISSQLQI